MKKPARLVLLIACLSLALNLPATAQIANARGHVVIPDSSVERPQDLGRRMHTTYVVYEFEDAASAAMTPPSPWKVAQPQLGEPTKGKFYETPASLACVYKLVTTATGCNPATFTTVPTGGGRAIAIVDAYDDPNAAGDLQAFDTQFGISAANFQVVYATGTKPPLDPTAGWEVEESLDIEWAHAMAPGATLYLVEAASSSNSDLLVAVGVASNLVAQAGGGEVSMSWGGAEFSTETSNDSSFTTANVVYLASSGDAPGPLWPGVSPNVVSAGGTSVSRNPTTGAYQTEIAWESAGGGPSKYEALPSYQSSLASLIGSKRAAPDVAFDADPHTGVWVYDSNPKNGVKPSNPWRVVGGTSISAPSLAGIINTAGNFYASSNAELTAIYGNRSNASEFNDTTAGACYYYAGYLAGTGWDFCTGVGTISGYVGK